MLEEAPAVASFTFGILTKAQVDALKSRGILVMGTATTVAEAKAWEAIGVDLVCAQGSEAGRIAERFLGISNRRLWERWRWCRKWWTRCASR